MTRTIPLPIIFIFIMITPIMIPIVCGVGATTPTVTPIFIPVTYTDTIKAQNRTYEIHAISQGDTVYLGDHIDISNVVAGTPALAWFTYGEPTESGVPYVIDLPEAKAGWYDFYIDPKIFGNKLGYWYKWNGYYEPHGNTVAFYILAMYRNATMTYPNGTIMNQSKLLSGSYTPVPTTTPYILPQKIVADYLVARGDSFNITVQEKTNLWLFGRNDQLLDVRSANNSIDISKEILSRLEPGSYTLMIQTIRNGTSDFTVKYDPSDNSIKWFDYKSFTIYKEPLEGYSPQVILEKFKQLIPSMQDIFKLYKFELQDPSIQIISMDEIEIRSAKEYYHASDVRGNVSVFDVRGYTNVRPGTTLYFALDEKQQIKNKIKWFNTTSMGTFTGAMRFFRVYIPIYWEETKGGMHTISGYTINGGSIYRDFDVNVAQSHSYIPSETVKWVDDRNPWVPTPTPIIKTVIQPPITVTVTVTVPVTPSNEQVYAQQKKVTDENNWFWGTRIIVGVTIIGVIWWVISLYIRRREMD